MKKISGWILTLIVTLGCLTAAECIARQKLPTDSIYTGYHRHWEMEWKIRQFEKWTRQNDLSSSIIFLGDSRIYSGINPEKLSTPSFNLGADGISIEGIRRILLPLITKSKKPAQVVLGFSALTLKNKGVWKDMYLESPAAKPWHPNSLLLKYSWLYAARKALSDAILYGWYGEKQPQLQNSPAHVTRLGYRPYWDYKPEQAEGLRRFFEKGISRNQEVPAIADEKYFDEKTFQELLDLVKRLEKHGIRTTLLITPEVMYPYAYNLKMRELFEAKLKQLKSHSISVLDFRDEKSVMNPESFADVYHLTESGSQTFSALLDSHLKVEK